MAYEQSEISKRIAGQGKEGALDLSSPGLIGYVTKYYGPNHFNDPAINHTVDVEVRTGQQVTKYNNVPCFVYSQGIIDHGLSENDRVWIQFINGDQKQPIVTAFYRDPSQAEMFWNDLKYGVSEFFHSLFHF
ncbi:hypothetical protein SAMN02799624_05432 [Paenibacillus sp. UNC496MF]|uniref:hypothetical protein n=1 Tax=Paenibacillus sp. UNC496MF TaxID=1502753 RepID=UPI0008E91F48|nr:hypothetical protein [Paenibacillus sp. UNC496MF]SFJ66049.1 hypothetical protein SAMN02799624_05432 [Paenibacillus sp. UNC496MF]